MPRYPFGTIVMLLSMIFVVFDMAKSLLDRYKITKPIALAVILLWWATSFWEVPIQWAPWNITINIGAFLMPLLLGLFLLMKSSSTSLRLWLALAVVIVSGLIGQLVLGFDQEHFFWDGRILFVFVGALSALLITGEARTALIAILLGHPVVEGVVAFLAGQGRFGDISGYVLGTPIAFDHVILALLFLWPLSLLMERFTSYDEVEEKAWLPLYFTEESSQEKAITEMNELNEMDDQDNEATLVEQEEYKAK
ncbi:hypothetical protein F9B85_02620 [Heliorestis acidaminivorans]|uniref:DUF1614 domain-containing protein n=1 Tax=Heliorestis acidaminivorans TaxID=553427 RepID=A0A6I0FAS6_9FIRM|nr:hypothetical protein [Heliorestis acidaminivorans]KAB2954588.1 hypothetical protein F9B85_02620 [Heliorestis acidaminivorans]